MWLMSEIILKSIFYIKFLPIQFFPHEMSEREHVGLVSELSSFQDNSLS